MVHANIENGQPFATELLVGEADRELATQPEKHRLRVKQEV